MGVYLEFRQAKEKERAEGVGIIENALRADERNVRGLFRICEDMKTAIEHEDYDELASRYQNFEAVLKSFHKAENFIERLGRRGLRGSIFKDLKKRLKGRRWF